MSSRRFFSMRRPALALLTTVVAIFGLSSADDLETGVREQSESTNGSLRLRHARSTSVSEDEPEVEEELVLRALASNLTEYEQKLERFRATTVLVGSQGNGGQQRPILFTHGSVSGAKADPSLAGFQIKPVKHKRLKRYADEAAPTFWDEMSHEVGDLGDDFLEVGPETIDSARLARRASNLDPYARKQPKDKYGGSDNSYALKEQNKSYSDGATADGFLKAYLSACKVSGSKKVAHCKNGQVCTPVLPHGRTCKDGAGYAGCQLEPRCLTQKESKKCEYDESCRLKREACIIVEECGSDKNYCNYWPRCFELGTFGEDEDDTKRVDSYFKLCKVKGSTKTALCLKEEKCVRTVQLTDPCLVGKKCYCTQYDPGCLVPGTATCEDMKCKRKCEYFPSAGCNQFVLGPCCPDKRKPYLLTCPAQPYCLIDYLKVKAKQPDVKKDVEPLPSDICDLEFDKGHPCNKDNKKYGVPEAYIRWSFNYKYGCQPNIYYGCGGNKNNFKTEAECQNNCLVYDSGYESHPGKKVPEYGAEKKGTYSSAPVVPYRQTSSYDEANGYPGQKDYTDDYAPNSIDGYNTDPVFEE